MNTPLTNLPLTNLIEQTVLDQMRNKASFTALDISNRLKQERYRVQHREVAEIVREIFQSGAMGFYDYDRELISVVTEGGAKAAQAFLYHFQEVRPRTYQVRTQDALPPPAPDRARDLADTAYASPIPVLHRPTRSVSGRRSRSRRDGALAVPCGLLRQLGWSAGICLSVDAEAGGLVLRPVTDGGKARVWNGQRLRVCRRTLRLGALSADCVIVEVEGTGLKVLAG